MKNIKHLVLACLIGTAGGVAHATPPYITVSKSELLGTPDIRFRDKRTMNLTAYGDYNGDGKTDKAYIARDTAKTKIYLIVRLSGQNNKFNQTIISWDSYKRLSDTYILTVSSIDFQNTSRQNRISVRIDSIEMGYFEVGGRVYFLKKGKFLSLPTGD